MKNSGINVAVLKEICHLAQIYRLDKVILFGSRARGDYKERSDIDLAVTGGDVVRFALEADDTTSTLLTYDIVNLDGPVQPELLEAIRKEGITLYEKV